jgi:surface antigen
MATISLAAFIGKYLAVPNVGDTPGNAGQCVGLIEKWLDANARPHIWGNAKDLLDQGQTIAGYKVVKNLPLNAPPVGAIVVWDGTWGNGNGHTAVVVAANRNRLAVFEQNNPAGAAPTVSTHDYAGILGWIIF